MNPSPRLLILVALFALAAAPAAPAQTAYRIDPSASTIVYAMHHPAHDWTGTSHRVNGSLTVEGERVTGGHVAAPVISFDSGNRSRDSNMASDTESYLYPNVSFDAQGVRYADDSTATVTGTLSFHGVTRPVTMPARIEMVGEGVHLQGHFEVTLTEFDLDRPSLLMVKTSDWLGLDVDLTALPS